MVVLQRVSVVGRKARDYAAAVKRPIDGFLVATMNELEALVVDHIRVHGG